MAKGIETYPLQYGTELGDGYLRMALASFLTEAYGVACDPEPMFITNGNSQAIDQVCSVFAPEGIGR